MMYLEEFAEIIEHLPQELRDRFTEMREMDLAVQNSMDSIQKKVEVFFANAKKMNPTERAAEHVAILKEYNKTSEDADEKVQLADQMHEIVNRYLRKLDQELSKCKGGLEADNEGITEILEKRSLESDKLSVKSRQKENRHRFNSNRSRDNHRSQSRGEKEKRKDSNASSSSVEKCMMADKISGSSRMSSSGSVSAPRPVSANSGRLISQVSSKPSAGTSNSVSDVSYNLGAGGNAITAAASRAIAVTQHMHQGRRTASLKASYEAINSGKEHTAEFSREITGAAQTAIAAIQESSKKNKKKVTSAGLRHVNVLAPLVQQQAHRQRLQQQQAAHQVRGTSQVLAVAGLDDIEWAFDPNEPKYCICNQVSYGDMVACDNESCPIEWFHYPCVNIMAPPKGKWYCPQCTSTMKRRGGRKN